MTTREAIRHAEGMLEMAKRLKMDGEMWPEGAEELLRTLTEAAKRAEGMVPGPAASAYNDDSAILEEEAVLSAVGYLEETIRDVEEGGLCVLANGERMGLVIEPALRASLAALKKICEDNGWERNSEQIDIEVEAEEELPKDVMEEIDRIIKGIAGGKPVDAKVIHMATIMVDKHKGERK